MIKIDKLIKDYDDKRVVNIDKLEIPDKMIFGIVGGNGSGKSTLLKMIAQLEDKTLGHIETGVDLDQMVYLFQKPHLFNTTVRKNIGSPLKFRKWDKDQIDKRVDELMKLFDIEHLGHMNALKLSGGEAQKVNLARALSFEPKWIFLDEPTANIDPKSTRQIEEILTSLDINMVLVTHNLNQATRMCSQVAVMFEGKVVEISAPEKALKHESLQYV